MICPALSVIPLQLAKNMAADTMNTPLPLALRVTENGTAN